MADITLLLRDLQSGQPDASGALPAQVYFRLRILAQKNKD
jgi:hypothetical protein